MRIGNLLRCIAPAKRTTLSAAVAVGVFLASPPITRAQDTAPPCNYYASPTGSGKGSTADQPFRVTDFWRVAKPGMTLCLSDGTYRGDSMITPPRGVAGRADAPITIQALHDGKVLVDGQGSRSPVVLMENDWFVVDGINACCSNENVVMIERSSHDVIRRVTGWDAGPGNFMVFAIHYGERNLLEDVAGWGRARKIFSSSQKGNLTTIRRAWGRWEGSEVIGPKMTYELAYNSYGLTLENCIGTWSGEKMSKSYVLGGYDGKPWIGRGGGRYDDYAVNQAHAIFALVGEKNARARLLGSLAYVTAKDTFKADQLVLVTRSDTSVELTDTVAYIAPGAYPKVRTFSLYGLTGSMERSGTTGLVAHDLTSLGGAGAQVGSDWDSRNLLEGASHGVYGAGESVFHTTHGANLCHRWVDGAETNLPLWPWPMNQRISEALVLSGRATVDVTGTVEAMFGAIPQECRD
jgi:hypothetical protein